MSFFEAPDPPPEPPEVPAAPEWIGPPENVLPGSFPLDALLVRTETTAIHIDTGRAFPNGFEFAFTMLRREPRTGRHDDPIMRWHEPIETELPNDVVRFGIELGDGRKATVFDRFRQRAFEQEPPPDTVLMQRGGSGGSHHWEIRFWVWPLPPAGPFVFVVEWPSEGIALTRVEIDSAPIREAASRAVELWPAADDGGSRVGGWSSQISTTLRNK